MAEIILGIFEAIGGYLKDFSQAGPRQRIIFFIILLVILAILAGVLMLHLNYSTEA